MAIDKKLEQWAKKLLDTGKSNQLVSYKDTKASTLEVVLPSAEELFGKVGGSSSFEVFDPRISEIEEDDLTPEEIAEGSISRKNEEKLDREAYIAKYSSKLKKNQILVYSSSANPITTLKSIEKKAKTAIEEIGVNVAYLAFGFIHWKENETSETEYRAPILLVPITFSNESAILPHYVKLTEDEVTVNPTFAYKMQAEQNVTLPEYEDEEELNSYLDRVEEAVKKMQWKVSRECKIGIFSFLKINMYRDLIDNQDKILKNGTVLKLLGEADSDTSSDLCPGDDAVKIDNELVDLHTVVDADSSQIEAIEMVKSGKSFVLQGPPGTGKSQTITNIIAECLADGKKVLFVSEKLAALNVVYDKLKKAGLEEFCLELHSHKANKKNVINDLYNTLYLAKTTVSSKADLEIEEKEKAQRRLDAYAKALHDEISLINMSPYQLYSAYSHFRNTEGEPFSISKITSKGIAELNQSCKLLEEYVQYLPTIGQDYHRNCWYGYSADKSFEGIQQSKADIEKALQIVEELISDAAVLDFYGINYKTLEEARKWMDSANLIGSSETITSNLLDESRFEFIKGKILEAIDASQKFCELRDKLLSVFSEEILELPGKERYSALIEKYSGMFSRLFSSEYKGFINGLRFCLKADGKIDYASAVNYYKMLTELQEAKKAFEEIEDTVQSSLGSIYKGHDSDWSQIRDDIAELDRLFKQGAVFGKLPSLSEKDYQSSREVIAKTAASVGNLFKNNYLLLQETAKGYQENIFDFWGTDLHSLAAKLSACKENGGVLGNWYRFNELLKRAEEDGLMPYISYVIEHQIPADQIVDKYQKAFYRQWIDYALQLKPELGEFSRIAQDQAVKVFSEKDSLQFDINKLKIKAELSQQRPSLDMVAAGSPIMTIQREGQKKRKQKSIRTLLAETGELVQILKPCFLMSPLSVSTFLSTDKIHFDTVVFDEASQIFPQDAIGAIYRGNQVIVVGDSRQMPPSNFFTSSVDVSDDDEEIGDVTDFESILDLCSGCMPQLRLNWHYRSRYEQLISFSNKNFYQNSLVTFPSSNADEKWVGVDYYYVDGLFDRKSKTNRKEAEFIVDLVYKNIEKFPERSLGVVAFSVAQQDLIDKLLNKRRQEDPSKEAYFSSDAKEPFFVKNLETVQGDERDTIIFSVAYGKDKDGRLLLNFGPLNREGGERRLNVAVTRAKSNVQLVSSMHATDIDLARVNSVGARMLREYLDYAEHGSIALDRSLSVDPLAWFDSDFETEVYDFLVANDFSVDTQVGCSSFRIDLALKIPNTSKYVLAIECDGATYHSSKNARDRDRLRQQILERMGWRFYRIWSTDWFKNKQIEKENLLKACYEALNNPVMIGGTNDRDSKEDHQKIDVSHFEEVQEKKVFEFPKYEMYSFFNEYSKNLPLFLADVLKSEAPLSEEWLLKRITNRYGRSKVTSVVREQYEKEMRNVADYGIVRRNGFLYLNGQNEFVLRVPGAVRDIKDIAVEELSAGMYEIIKQNYSITKDGLYHTLGELLGVSRIGDAILARFNEALQGLENCVDIENETISLKINNE